MEILERLLEKSKKIATLSARKTAITHNKTILHGAPKVGKTSLARSYICNFDKALYLNLKDPRIDTLLPFLVSNIKHFCREKNIEAIAIDNYTPTFPIPALASVLLISENDFTLQGYKNLTLHGLDFEEYWSLNKRHHNPRLLLNLFLKDGSLPEISALEDSAKNKRKQEILQLICADKAELTVFYELFICMGQKVTINQLYTLLKRKIQISKDRIYATIHDYHARGILYFVEKFEQSNAPKKLFFWDFTLANALSYERNFGALLENMLFLELLKEDEKLFYTDRVDFILPNKAKGILIMPFCTLESLEMRLAKIHKEREFLDLFIIITLGFSHTGENLGTPYVAISFWEFALGGAQ